jgi:hypothetical protein
MPCVGIDSGQFYLEELKRDQFDLFQIKFSFAILLILSITVKDWAKPPLDHVDPHHKISHLEGKGPPSGICVNFLSRLSGFQTVAD